MRSLKGDRFCFHYSFSLLERNEADVMRKHVIRLFSIDRDFLILTKGLTPFIRFFKL